MRLLSIVLPVCFSILASSPAFARDTPPSFKKVVLIVLENTDYSVALQQPFIKSVAKNGVTFEQFFADTHPSQPNYIVMIAGSTMGVKDDGSVSVPGEHLGNLLERKGLTWKTYAEDYPGNCFKGEFQAPFARKHVPFLSFDNVLNDPKECANIVNAQQFQSDLQAGTLPTYSMFIPNLNNDGHDTNPAYADKWLAKTFGPQIADPKLMKDLLLIITYDESLQYNAPNQILTLFLGGSVQPGLKIKSITHHSDVLRTIEDRFQLGSLGRADQTAKPISGIWRSAH